MLILNNVQAVPSRLTVSRLEQVPELPKDYGLQKLLAGGGAMEPPNDTSRWGPGHDGHIISMFVYICLIFHICIRSVANMSVMTVTGTVFGPGMETSHNPGQGLQRQGSGGRGGRWSTMFGEYVQEFIFLVEN